jgi:hypothetical protein
MVTSKRIADDNEQCFMAESFPFPTDGATVPKMTYLEQSARNRFGK